MTQVRWEVDDRRPTLWARAYVAGMRARRDKETFEGEEHTLDTARDKQRSGDAPPTALTRLRYDVRSDRLDGMTVWTVRPRRAVPRARVVYFHGGGYIHPLTVDYWRLVRALVRAPAEVVVRRTRWRPTPRPTTSCRACSGSSGRRPARTTTCRSP